MYVVKEQSRRYETVDTLSNGAMGSVVLARDRLMNRLVAIKSIKLGDASEAERQRRQDALLSEAQVVQLLSHPHIVAIHDVLDEPEDHGPALVLEYVQGSNLEEYLKGGHPLPLDFALTIGIQVAQALEHAHSMGVIHGDIKPANILISDDGEQAKIADFGIAQLTNSASDDPRLFGTPRYVSPEQLLGQKADQRSDLFSLGVVLYEMLTGRSPFAGQTSKEITQAIARGDADLSAETLQEVPEPLHPVLAQCLERDPAKRYQSARQIAEALQDPGQVEETEDTVATQDLSSLVVPDLPEGDDSGEKLTLPDTEPEPQQDAAVDETVESQEPVEGAGHYSAPTESQPWLRWALIGAAAAIPTLIIAIAILWLATPASPPDARFSPDHRLRARVMPLFKEGRRQMQAGQPEVAARLFRRAQDLAPAASEMALALEQAERDAVRQQAQMARADEVEGLLTASREALDAGNSQRALKQATQALSIDPENPEAQALVDAASVSRAQRAGSSPRRQEPASEAPPRRQESPQIVQSERRSTTVAPPTSTPLQSPRAASPPTRNRATVPPAPVPATASLRVDVFSYLSKGVLTVYADQDQVLLKPFRFVQKSGFMRKKKTAGRLETSVELPSGPTEFRIYVSADGQETQTVNLAANLDGGQTHVLRLIIAENGSASAQLN